MRELAEIFVEKALEVNISLNRTFMIDSYEMFISFVISGVQK